MGVLLQPHGDRGHRTGSSGMRGWKLDLGTARAQMLAEETRDSLCHEKRGGTGLRMQLAPSGQQLQEGREPESEAVRSRTIRTTRGDQGDKDWEGRMGHWGGQSFPGHTGLLLKILKEFSSLPYQRSQRPWSWSKLPHDFWQKSIFVRLNFLIFEMGLKINGPQRIISAFNGDSRRKSAFVNRQLAHVV